MVRQENGAACEIEPSAPSEPSVPLRSLHVSAVDMTLLGKLQELKEEYSSALETAKEKNDILHAKRYSYVIIYSILHVFSYSPSRNRKIFHFKMVLRFLLCFMLIVDT